MKLDILRLALFAALAFAALGGAFAACTTTPAVVIKPCDDPGPVLVRGEETGFEFCTAGPVHRPKIQACPRFEPASATCADSADAGTVSSCHSNADCAEPGTVAACGSAGPQKPCVCVPSCVTDADCSPGQLCECGDPFSFCRGAYCHSDAECQGGSLCVASGLEECGVPGFACQSELDECLTDLDCPEGSPCHYITDHRICANFGCDK